MFIMTRNTDDWPIIIPVSRINEITLVHGEDESTILFFEKDNGFAIAREDYEHNHVATIRFESILECLNGANS